LFVGLFIYKGLTLKKIIDSFKFTAVVIGTVMFILGSTKAFGQLVTIYDIPESILNLFQVLANHPEIVMLLIGIFYIFIGMWLEKCCSDSYIYSCIFAISSKIRN
jgi:C4-dicarboxylate transporter DctM subunit